MEIISKTNKGNISIDGRYIEDLAMNRVRNIDNVYPGSKIFAHSKLIDGSINLDIDIKIKYGIDVVKTCEEIQKNIFDSIYEISNIKIKNINIIIQGFEK